MKTSNLILAALIACAQFIAQNNLKLKVIAEDPSEDKFRYREFPFSSFSVEEMPQYINLRKITSYTVTESYYILSSIRSINKENFEIHVINPSYKDLKDALYQKFGSKYMGYINYTNAFMSDNNVFDFIYSYKDKNKNGDYVISTTVFRYNEKNELIDAKILFQLPSISAYNYGEVLATYISSDRKRLCIVNTLPYTSKENLKLERRIYDLKTYELLDSKEIEVPFVFKGRSNMLSFRINKFKNSFALSLITKDEKDVLSLLAFYFNESNNFQPRTIFYPLEKYSQLDYSLLEIPDNNNLYFCIRYYELNKKFADKKSSDLGFAYALIDIDNSKVNDLTEIELKDDYLKSVFGKSKKLLQDKSFFPQIPLCTGLNQFVLPIISFYVAGTGVAEYEKVILFKINNKSIQNSYEFEYNTVPSKDNLDFDYLTPNKLFISSEGSYNQLEEKMPNLMKGIKVPANKKESGLFYQIYDVSAQSVVKKDFLLVKNPANSGKYLSLIKMFPIYDADNPFSMKKVLLIFEDGFIGLAEFTD